MLTSEQIIEEIKLAMTLNSNTKAKCNETLTHAMSFIIHEAKELEDRLVKEYERGLKESWEIARELCKTGYSECSEIFGDETVEYVIKNYNPLKVKSMMESYKEEKESKKIFVGDIIKNKNDETKATILDNDNLENEECWTVRVYRKRMC